MIKSIERQDVAAHDETLLDRARTQWLLGDRQGLIRIPWQAIENHPERAELALLTAAGHAQLGSMDPARRFVSLARDWGCRRNLMARVLIAGVYDSLGRAAALLDQDARARKHYEYAASCRSGGQSHAPMNDKYAVLAFIHDVLQPAFYLEIGVGEGQSLALARCDAVGVDPVPRDLAAPGEKARVIVATSDEFFSSMAREIISSPPDLVLLDGMPLVDYTLRDLAHVERLAAPHTLVVVPGIHPRNPEHATRRRTGPHWTGDVWKLPAILEAHRPDLRLLALDVEPSGLLLIAGLNPQSRAIEEHCAAIQAHHVNMDPPPPGVIERTGAVAVGDPRLPVFLQTLGVKCGNEREASQT